MTHKNHFIISCFGSLALLTFAACADDDDTEISGAKKFNMWEE